MKKVKTSLEEHLDWLDGKLPSELFSENDKDFSNAPIYHFFLGKCKKLAMQRYESRGGYLQKPRKKDRRPLEELK